MTYKRELQNIKIRKEDKLLLLCARTRINNEIKSQIMSLIQQEIDWNYLLQKSYEHRLTPLLYLQLNNVCPDSIPQNIMKTLKTYFQENAHKNLLFMGELSKILKLFKSDEITAIPYKGPILASQVYGNLALREFDDLDIYVNKKDVHSAKKILLSEGYETKLSLKDNQEEKYLKSQREYKFINPNNQIHLEIHWNFIGLSISGKWDCFENHMKFLSAKIHNTDILNLKFEDMLLILCLHASGHLWERLTWICDINEYIKSNNNIDWQYLMETADELGIRRILNINLLLAIDLLTLKIPDKIALELKSDESLINLDHKIKQNLFEGDEHSRGLYNKAIMRLMIRENYNNKILDILKLIFTPTNNEWEHYPLPSKLYPLYYFLRSLNLLKNNY